MGCLTTKLRILIGELGYLLEICKELGLTGHELGSEGDFCGGGSRNISAITGSNCGKVGDILDHVSMVDSDVGGLGTGAGSGDLRLPSFLVRSCKEHFEGGPVLICKVLAPPNIAVVVEQASLKHKLVGEGDDLLRSVQSSACCRIFDSIFDLICSVFNGIIGVVCSTKPGIVVLQVGRGNVGIIGVEMV